MPNEPSNPHCTRHASFRKDCPTCTRALANSLPYPVKKTASPVRSYGVKGDITAEVFAEPEASISLKALRILIKLVWPFGRIL